MVSKRDTSGSSWQQAQERERMDDGALLRAFANTGSCQAAGQRLEILGDGLLLDGWWYVAMRVSDDSYLVRAEDPPSEYSILRELARELSERGLRELGEEVEESLSHVVALTCTELSIGSAGCWSLWAKDRAAGVAAIAKRIRRESDSSLLDAPHLGCRSEPTGGVVP